MEEIENSIDRLNSILDEDIKNLENEIEKLEASNNQKKELIEKLNKLLSMDQNKN
jgi:cell division protein FtsB